MRILLLYDNFIRDFRGLLLLKYLLTVKGHKVWIKATWNSPLSFAKIMDIDVLVAGQIAEASTHQSGKFAFENNIRLVLNSTENVTVQKKFELFITYNTSQLNDDIIDVQSIAARDVYEFIQGHPLIKKTNKNKYKFLGFPRLDLTINEGFRNIEASEFRKKYNLKRGGKVYLFISSFLLDGAFDGVPDRDLEKWDITEFRKRNQDLLKVTSEILLRVKNEIMRENDTLLIKKHPWDCSAYFKSTFEFGNCIVLDNTDYIVPCITNSDFILHSYSTSAIEAWLLNKKTISILPERYRRTTTLNHMENELVISTFEELKILLDNYPKENPSVKSLVIFHPNLDGQATVRLADEIHKLTPHAEKTRFNYPLKSKLKARLKEWLYDQGLLRYDVNKRAKPNTKLYDFYVWENSKPQVIKTYSKHFKKYARQYAKNGA